MTIPTNPVYCDGAVENLCLEYSVVLGAGSWQSVIGMLTGTLF